MYSKTNQIDRDNEILVVIDTKEILHSNGLLQFRNPMIQH